MRGETRVGKRYLGVRWERRERKWKVEDVPTAHAQNRDA